MEYGRRYDEIRALGADVAAVSVDTPDRSRAMQRRLEIPFPLLCDPTRDTILSWGLLNRWEAGGIARTATFVIGPGRTVHLQSVESMAVWVTPDEVVDYVRMSVAAPALHEPKRRLVVPSVREWVEAARGLARFGFTSPRPKRERRTDEVDDLDIPATPEDAAGPETPPASPSAPVPPASGDAGEEPPPGRGA